MRPGHEILSVGSKITLRDFSDQLSSTYQWLSNFIAFCLWTERTRMYTSRQSTQWSLEIWYSFGVTVCPVVVSREGGLIYRLLSWLNNVSAVKQMNVYLTMCSFLASLLVFIIVALNLSHALVTRRSNVITCLFKYLGK